MLSRPLQVLTALGTILIASQAYTIDDDCGDDTDFIRGKVDAAFALAAQAVTELQRQPINPEIEHVFEQLFGTTPANRDQMEQNVIEEKLSNLAAISEYNTPPPGSLSTDVRFYCTTKRIEKRKDGRYYNKEQNYVYPEGEITNRFASCYDLRPPTLGITTNPEGGPSEIQLCPWFITNVRGFRFTDFKSINAIAWGGLSKVVMPGVAAMVYTPIDAFHLMDKVILHELTHTTQSGLAVDMGDPGSPYGWKNCKELAQLFLSRVGGDPQNNSDSIALMCSAIQLILTGVTVEDSGKLDLPQRNNRRDVVMYPVTWVA